MENDPTVAYEIDGTNWTLFSLMSVESKGIFVTKPSDTKFINGIFSA